MGTLFTFPHPFPQHSTLIHRAIQHLIHSFIHSPARTPCQTTATSTLTLPADAASLKRSPKCSPRSRVIDTAVRATRTSRAHRTSKSIRTDPVKTPTTVHLLSREVPLELTPSHPSRLNTATTPLHLISRVRLSNPTAIKRRPKRMDCPKVRFRLILANNKPQVPPTLEMPFNLTTTPRSKWTLPMVLRTALVATTTDP